MREIKFKAWDVVNKKWIGGKHLEYLCVSNDIAVLVKYKVAPNGSYEPYYCKQLTNPEFDNLKIIQFTGLLDKNSNEIYEGDILKRGLTFDEVIFDEGAFCIKFYSQGFKKTYIHSMKSTLFNKINKWEIIGNKFNNPELLEAVK